ncbi:quinone oxidoreductase family protein [Flavisphingomonas formosensis]|uniref:quinone oxidoreductase family protein n=1 Tax=Flavisphingomonas formosensis TaxID=861534 RepID=UPI0012FC827D|nr:quinone oxidoreductase [Sphingomonas formosensis]
MNEPYRIIIRSHGGPEVIERENIALPEPGPGEVRIRVAASGLNFIDTYHRSGLYPLAMPSGLGVEGGGTVEAVGESVTDMRTGDRVAFLVRAGSYATHVVVPATMTVTLPEGVSEEVAAGAFMKGLTSWMLVEPCAKIHAGQSALVHGAAGGVGQVLVQWLKAIGVTVIAHAGSPEKADRATALGADHALSCPYDALAGTVRDLTGGRGVDVVFDGIGAASWAASLAATARCGLVITYGNASGPVPPFSALDLLRAGSLFVTRPTLYDYIAAPGTLQSAGRTLFEMVVDGRLKVGIDQRFPLSEAAEAHRALEGRQTTGSTILVP